MSIYIIIVSLREPWKDLSEIKDKAVDLLGCLNCIQKQKKDHNLVFEKKSIEIKLPSGSVQFRFQLSPLNYCSINRRAMFMPYRLHHLLCFAHLAVLSFEMLLIGNYR